MTLKERFAAWIVRREIAKALEGWIERSLGRKPNHKEKGMLNAFLGNWKTTVIGVAMAALQLHQGGLTWQSAIAAALMAALGISAKDSTTGSQAHS